jgi:hypothetical protein
MDSSVLLARMPTTPASADMRSYVQAFLSIAILFFVCSPEWGQKNLRTEEERESAPDRLFYRSQDTESDLGDSELTTAFLSLSLEHDNTDLP